MNGVIASALGALLLTNLIAPNGQAQSLDADGMAGASRLLPRPGGSNPAAVAIARGGWIEVASFGGSAGNDRLSMRDYRRWNGATWSEEDKREILARFHHGTLSIHARGEMTPCAAGGAGWAIGLNAVAAARAEVPRPWAELALYGNAPGRRYRLDRLGGHAIAYSELSLTRAWMLRESWLSQLARRLNFDPLPDQGVAFGARLDLLRGWGFAEVTRSAGELITTLDAVNGHAEIRSTSSTGGIGVGLDFGLIARDARGWAVSLDARHLPAWIYWMSENEDHLSAVTADSLTLDQSGEDDLIDQRTESHPVGNFRRALAPSIHLGVARRLERWHLEADLDQALAKSAETRTRPRGAIGASLLADRHLEIRGGIALGGMEGAVLAAGVGTRWRRLAIDLGLQSTGSLAIFEPRGIGAGLRVTLGPSLRRPF